MYLLPPAMTQKGVTPDSNMACIHAHGQAFIYVRIVVQELEGSPALPLLPVLLALRK